MNTNTLIRPVITEKSMSDAADNVYTFEVDTNATKHKVKSAVESTFSVKVNKVTTTTRKPKAKKTGRKRLPSSTSTQKIARVWLNEKDKIDLFEFKEE